MPQPPRILYVYDKGSTLNIFDNDDQSCLYTVRFSSRTNFDLIAMRDRGSSAKVGRAVYNVIKRFSFLTRLNISLYGTSTPGAMAFNKEGRLFANKRVLHSGTLGTLHFRTRVADNPWKAGAPETTFMGCVDHNGQAVAEYREEGYDIKRMGRLEIKKELSQDGLDEIVLSAIAMIMVVRAL